MSDKYHRPEVPKPAHPHRRLEPLPWQQPKPTSEDTECARTLQAILDSPSYTPAIQDVGFLDGDDARGVRLQLDYLKPNRVLQAQGVQHTIVVFGSTRIVEPLAAQRKVDQLREALAAQADDRELQHRLAVAERILAKSHYYDIAREFSRLVANAGKGPGDARLVVMTGGGPGVMEATNRGAHDTSAKSVGLNIILPNEQYPNPYITPELCFQFIISLCEKCILCCVRGRW